MGWETTESEEFTARHAAAHADEAETVLEALSELRRSLVDLFPRLPTNLTVVLHDSTTQLLLAQPWLAVARRFSSPAGRRYMTGWFSHSEIHCLAPSVMRRIAGGEESLQALLLTPQRYYTMLSVGISNPLLPPPFRPASMTHMLRHAWQIEGAGQYFSGQLQHLRAAIAIRLRSGSVRFPPPARDAALLGGAVYDLLARERGRRACVRLACHPARSEDRALVEEAFGFPRHELTRMWRSHLEEIASPEPRAEAIFNS